ncbi:MULTISPECIES: DUF937 domain-containing protein [unclassified Streptomyces]|uniref:DUF937 domain-containing protein n=1 Tax=unclassified Streptomyces TaxID=2593676 RepID=UPI0011CDA353|nr:MULTISPECIES: DUF937 domain-containing protein [unclassified Streptomyces]TXS76222.1 hypothetical protein EAO69_07060 [Streptomyces sp. me109]
MNEEPLQQDVLDALDDAGLQEIAGLLGTDTAGAREVVGTTVSEFSGGLQDRAVTDPGEVQQAFAEAQEAPLTGVATLGGMGGLGGGLMGGLLARISRPVANAVARKTGLPPATVARVIDLVIPVLLSVLSKRATRGTRK